MLPDNILGLLTVVWALHAPTQIQREHWPTATIQELANAETLNKRLMSRTLPSSDPVLDEEAWFK